MQISITLTVLFSRQTEPFRKPSEVSQNAIAITK